MNKIALALTTATLISFPLTAPAFAHADGPDYYRVVNVQGSGMLNLRARPGIFAPALNKIPFNARHLSNRIETSGRWTRIEYKGQTGWVHKNYLAEDTEGAPTIYKVVGVNRWDALNIRRKPRVDARLIGEIPGSADYVEDCGACKGVWCPVRYNKVDGWVHKRFLAVVDYAGPNRNLENNQSFNDQSLNDPSLNGRQDFRDRYGNEYMGLGTRRGRTWWNRWPGQ